MCVFLFVCVRMRVLLFVYVLSNHSNDVNEAADGTVHLSFWGVELVTTATASHPTQMPGKY